MPASQLKSVGRFSLYVSVSTGNVLFSVSISTNISVALDTSENECPVPTARTNNPSFSVSFTVSINCLLGSWLYILKRLYLLLFYCIYPCLSEFFEQACCSIWSFFFRSFNTSHYFNDNFYGLFGKLFFYLPGIFYCPRLSVYQKVMSFGFPKRKSAILLNRLGLSFGITTVFNG